MSFRNQFLVCLLCSASAVVAQNNPIENGETVLIRGQWVLSENDGLGVGAGTSGNTLAITNGGLVGASSMLVGGSSLADNNQIIVFEGGTLSITNDLMLGRYGSDNQLYIAGSVDSGSAVIGAESGSDGNGALLSGTSAVWNVEGKLTIGKIGDENVVTLTNGASLAAGSIVVGENSEENELLIYGGSSVTSATLVVGTSGMDNMVVVTNGGMMAVGNTEVGNSSAALNNILLISGTNSSYLNSEDLVIGAAGAQDNAVTVTNAGYLEVSGDVIISSNNYLNVDAGGHLKKNGDFDASMSGFNFGEEATLGVTGELTGLTNSLDQGRSLYLEGEDARLNMSTDSFYVGQLSATNAFEINDQAVASFQNLYVGIGSNAFENVVSVTNGGTLSVASTLQVGTSDSYNNEVSVYSGSKVLTGDGLVIEGSNNVFNLNAGGQLVVSNNFDAGMAGFNFNSGSTLQIGGALSNMDNAIEGQRTLVLSGGTWSAPAEDLFVGTNSAANTVIIEEGGSISVNDGVIGLSESANNNEIIIRGTGSELVNAGSLTVGVNGTGNRMLVEDGAMATSQSAVIGASNGMNQVTVSGTNAVWAINNDLTVGAAGNDNLLEILEGGVVNSGAAVISGTTNSTGNRVLVRGQNSAWNVTGDLAVGANGGRGSLALDDRAVLGATGQLAVNSGSSITFSSNATASAGSYFQAESASMSFDSVTNVAVDTTTALIVASGGAEFEAGALIDFSGEMGILDIDRVYTNLLVTSGNLVVGGTNISNGVVAGLTSDNEGSLLNLDFYASSDDLYTRLLRSSIASTAGFAPGSQMAGVSDEIDGMANTGNPAAEKQLELLNGMSGAAINSQMTQLYSQSAPTYQHMNAMTEGIANIRRRGLLPEPLWAAGPDGVEGPHRYGQELYGRQSQMWIKGYGSRGTRDESDSFSGFDQTIYGTVIGVDKSWGDLLGGIAGGYAGSNIDQENGDVSEATTGYGVLYGAWGTLDWFADANLAYGRSSIENRSGTAFGTTGDVDADQVAFYMGGGKEFIVGREQLLLTPSLGLQGSWFMQDSYTESAGNAVPRQIESYDYMSLQSKLGLKAATVYKFVTFDLMPEIQLNWLHEFNDSFDDIGYSLVGGADKYTLAMQSPVADMLELGLGLSSRHLYDDDEVLEFTLQLDGRMGDGYTGMGASIRALYEF